MTEILLVAGLVVVIFLFAKYSNSSLATKARGAVNRLIGLDTPTQQK